MAFNWKTFRTRTLTAIIFAAVMLVGLLWNQWSFLILFSIIHFGCWWEYLKLAEKIYGSSFHAYTKLGLMVMGYGLMLWFCGPSFHINTYGLKENISLPVSAAGFALLLIGIFQKNKINLKAFGMAVLGLIYISLSWGFMMYLYSFAAHIHGIDLLKYVTPPGALPLLIISCIWINDTMAYIVGSLIGKTPLSKISPKKTWEGTIGGIILAVVVVFLVFTIGYSYDSILAKYDPLACTLVAFVVSITGTLGDLFESKLKRLAHVKDSGSLMPGHGGFLDRFDSLLFAIPFAWILITLL